jgi:hypothetical protein
MQKENPDTQDILKYLLLAGGAYLVWLYVIQPMLTSTPAVAAGTNTGTGTGTGTGTQTQTGTGTTTTTTSGSTTGTIPPIGNSPTPPVVTPASNTPTSAQLTAWMQNAISSPQATVSQWNWAMGILINGANPSTGAPNPGPFVGPGVNLPGFTSEGQLATSDQYLSALASFQATGGIVPGLSGVGLGFLPRFSMSFGHGISGAGGGSRRFGRKEYVH